MDKEKSTFSMSVMTISLALYSAGILWAAPSVPVPTMGEKAAKNIEEGIIPAGLAETEMSPVTVAAHSFGVPIRNTGVSVTRIEASTMEKEGVYSLDGAIARAPGVYINNEAGQRGAMSPVRVRGLNSATYTLTVVDGIRISDANVVGSAFFGTQSLLGFGSVEVVRGPQGALYGAQAVGGIISLSLPTGTGEPSYKLFAEGGSFGSFTGAASAQGRVDKLSYSLLGGYETTQNDPQHPARYGVAPGSMDFSQYFESAKLQYAINDKSRLSFSIRRSDAKYEVPSYQPEQITRLKDTMDFTLMSASYEADLTRIWSTELLLGYYGYNYAEYGERDWGYGMGPEDAYAATDYHKTQVEWKNLLKWNDQWKTSIGTAWDRVDYLNPPNIPKNGHVESIYSAYAEQFWTPLAGLDFSLAGRWEHYDQWGNQSAWRFGSSWMVTGEESPTRLFATVGSGFRAPTQVDLYGWGGYNGNPNLNPTDAIGYDLGIEQKLDKNHTLTLTGFWTHLSDMIDASNMSLPPVNAGSADSYGMESAVVGDFKDAWNSGYTVAYTYTNPVDKEGKQLACTARHVVSADIHTSPIESVTVGLGLESALRRTNFGGASPAYVDDYCNMRLYVRWKVSENVTLHARVENLLNQEYMLSDQSSPWDYTAPTPARRIGFFGGATIEF